MSKPPAATSDSQERVLWPSDLAHRYGVDRTTIWRWRQQNRLPPPDVKIGPHDGWRATTIAAHEFAGSSAAAAAQ